MSLLRWVETSVGTSKSFLKAEIINLNIDFGDICGNRFWGSDKFYLQIKFSIHERITYTDGWTHQLLAPNGIHVYCKGIEEAKEIAEVMYRRILDAFSEQVNIRPTEKKLKETLDYHKMTREQFNRVMYKKFCRNTKDKTEKLLTLLKKRGIVGRVYYSRLRSQIGWMFTFNGGEPQLLGSNYEQALDFIGSGTLDFLKEVG